MSTRFHEQSHNEPTVATAHGARGNAVAGPSHAPGRVSEDSSLADHVQEKKTPEVPLTKKQKVKRHCGRFKWWYLAAGLVLLIILLPVFFTVVIPAITQSIVANQKLPILGGTFLAMSPTQLSVTLETQLDTPLAASLDPLTLFVYNKETPEYTPFINITLPKLHVNGKTKVTVTNQTVTVSDESELVKWFGRIFDQNKVDLSVKGKSTVHLGALHSGVKVDKTIEVGALNGLNGFGISKLRLLLPAMDDGTNVQGTLNLPNTGVLTLGLGNLTLDLFSGSLNIGYITLYDVLLNPGNNTRHFDGQLYLNELLPNLGLLLDSQAEALAEGNIRLIAKGNSTIVNGQHIGYIEKVLNDRELITNVPVIKLLGDVISSFSGGGTASLTDLVGDTIGNSTFIEGLLGHWNVSAPGSEGSGSAVKGRSPQFGSRTIKAPATKSLLKMGLKLALAKL